MKKTLFVAVALAFNVSAHATVTASTYGGASFLHLGKLSRAACQAVMESPVTASLNVVVDGDEMPTGDVTCHDGIKVDLMTTQPVVKTTPTDITTWPLAKSDCMVLATKQLEKGAIRINGVSVTKTDQVEHACSKSSNAVTVPL
jgi:hypothetical protein